MEATDERAGAIMEAFKTIKSQTDSLEQLIRNLGISNHMEAQGLIPSGEGPLIRLLYGRMYPIGALFGISIYTYVISGDFVTVDAVISFARLEDNPVQCNSKTEIVRLLARVYPLTPDKTPQVDGVPTWKKICFPKYGQSGDGAFEALMDILSVPTKEDHDDYLTQKRAMGVIGCLVAGAINLTQEDVPD